MKNKTWKRWTSEECELLKIHWKESSMEDLLLAFPGRTYSVLMQKARELGIKSETQRQRHGTLKFLDNLTVDSSYWWGFIMADGHVAERGELIISLSEKDVDHLKILGGLLHTKVICRSFVNSYTGNISRCCTLCIADKSFATKWRSLLHITGKKTYMPPDLSIFLTKELLLPFFIGLVDGDGCIWESKGWLNLRIELHANWFNTLTTISKHLYEFYGIDSKVKITKRETAKIDINTKDSLKILKKYSNNIKCMNRKWLKLEPLMSQ